MKVVKIILGLVAAGTLLVGGFTAGTFISQTRAASAPVQQSAQPTFIPQQQIQPTVVPQQPQATPIPPQGQWRQGMWMMDPNFVAQGQRGWGMYEWDEDNWNGMRGWNNNNWGGMHRGMMGGYGWQTNPNWNLTQIAPQDSPAYATPSTPSSFKDDVQPIFTARCVACHGGTNSLYLDTYENVLKGSRNGAVVIPGDVYNSRLAYYVYSGYMPFRNTPLAATEIQTILDWIAAGAPNN